MQLQPSIKWKPNRAVIDRLTSAYTKRSLNGVKEALEAAASMGAKATLDFKINSGTPTGTVWHYLTNVAVRNQDPGARKDTGRMAASVGHSKATGNVILTSTYGLPMNGPDYFFEQEYGFRFTTWSGVQRDVPGMADPRYGAQKKIDSTISRSLNKAMTAKGFFRSGSRATARFERVYEKAQDIGFGAAWRLEFPGPDSGNMRAYIDRASSRRAQEIFMAERMEMTTYENILRQNGKAAAELFRNRFRR